MWQQAGPLFFLKNQERTLDWLHLTSNFFHLLEINGIITSISIDGKNLSTSQNLLNREWYRSLRVWPKTSLEAEPFKTSTWGWGSLILCLFQDGRTTLLGCASHLAGGLVSPRWYLLIPLHFQHVFFWNYFCKWMEMGCMVINAFGLTSSNQTI